MLLSHGFPTKGKLLSTDLNVSLDRLYFQKLIRATIADRLYAFQLKAHLGRLCLCGLTLNGSQLMQHDDEPKWRFNADCLWNVIDLFTKYENEDKEK